MLLKMFSNLSQKVLLITVLGYYYFMLNHYNNMIF